MLIGNIEVHPENEPCRILAVDDDPVILELLKIFITSFGYSCQLAGDGQEALEKLKNHEIDIIVTDIMMPRMDGMQLLKKARELYPKTDVIIVTGHAGTFTYVDVIKAGAIDYISKPFDEDELQAKLSRVLRERSIIRELERLSQSDALTELHNRRYFDIKLKEETQRADRQGYDVFLMLIDVDKFKDYNDTYGHQEGDKLLKKLGELMSQCVRKSVDWCFRYGGDEFAIIIPQAEREQAVDIGTRLMSRYQEANFDTTGLSIGVAEFCRHAEKHTFEEDIEDLLRRADKALYCAKKGGGKQIIADRVE